MAANLVVYLIGFLISLLAALKRLLLVSD